MVAVLVVGAWWGRGMSGPWGHGFDGFQGGAFASMARNADRIGLDTTGPYPVFNGEGGRDTPLHYYANHPPTLTLLVTAAHRLGGGSEAWIRAPFLAASLAAWLLVMALAHRLAGREAAVAAGLAAALLPGWAEHATLINYEVLVMPFALAAVLDSLKAEEGEVASWRPGLWLALGVCIDQGAFLLAPWMWLAAWHRRGFHLALRRAPALLLVPALPLMVHSWLASGLPTPAPRAGMLDRAAMILSPLWTNEIPLPEWLRIQAGHIGLMATLPAAVLAAMGLWSGRRRAEGAWLPLAGLAVTYPFLLYRHSGSSVGDGQYPLWFYALPVIALGLGMGWRAAADSGRTPAAGLVAGVLVLVLLMGGRDLRSGRMAEPTEQAWGEEVALATRPGDLVLVPAAWGWTPAVSYYARRTVIPTTDGPSTPGLAGKAYLFGAYRTDPARTAPVTVLHRDAEGRLVANRLGELPWDRESGLLTVPE